MIFSVPLPANWNAKLEFLLSVFAVIVSALKFVPPIKSSLVIKATNPRLRLKTVPVVSGIHCWPTFGLGENGLLRLLM